MNIRLFSFTIICIITFLSCANSVSRHTLESYDAKNSSFSMPRRLVFDTIRGPFYFEEYIPLYFRRSLKKGGFIRSQKIDENAYKSGYFVVDQNFVSQNLKSLPNANIHRLAKFDYLIKAVPSGRNFQVGTKTVGCDLHYRKVFLEIIVLSVGKVKEVIPDFRICNELTSKGQEFGKNKIKKVEKFFILDVREVNADSSDWNWNSD